jgi:hypothetical protein
VPLLSYRRNVPRGGDRWDLDAPFEVEIEVLGLKARGQGTDSYSATEAATRAVLKLLPSVPDKK